MTSPRCVSVPWKDGLRLVGDPVDVVTGAQTSFETDFWLQGDHIPVSWVRYYDSRRHQIDRGVGHGFWFALDLELRFELDGLTFVGEQGDRIEFPFLPQDSERVLRGGHELERISSTIHCVHCPGNDPSLEFRFDREADLTGFSRFGR